MPGLVKSKRGRLFSASLINVKTVRRQNVVRLKPTSKHGASRLRARIAQSIFWRQRELNTLHSNRRMGIVSLESLRGNPSRRTEIIRVEKQLEKIERQINEKERVIRNLSAKKARLERS